MEIEIKQQKDRRKQPINAYNVTMKGLSAGAIMALQTALARHVAGGSAVADDVLGFLNAAISTNEELAKKSNSFRTRLRNCRLVNKEHAHETSADKKTSITKPLSEAGE